MKRVSEAVVLMRVSRYSAWVATVTILMFIVTGFGSVKRFMDPDISKFLHEKVLPVPLFICLVLHVGVSARGALRRWRVFESVLATDLYVAAISVALLGAFFWMFLK
jgi:hypothetical protein